MRQRFTTRAHVTIVVRGFEGGECVCFDFELKVCGRTLGSKTSRWMPAPGAQNFGQERGSMDGEIKDGKRKQEDTKLIGTGTEAESAS